MCTCGKKNSGDKTGKMAYKKNLFWFSRLWHSLIYLYFIVLSKAIVYQRYSYACPCKYDTVWSKLITKDSLVETLLYDGLVAWVFGL
jgi:hypothetical protein